MMATAGNSSGNAADNAGNGDNMPTANLNTRVNSINDNSHDYFSFNMHLVSNYMNNQLIYYYIFSTILTAEQACFQHVRNPTLTLQRSHQKKVIPRLVT